MKDSAWYNKLWQTKMQELPLQEDEHVAWKKMQTLLDHHMPVTNPVVGPKPGISLWVKLMYVLAAVISAAILYYAASRMLAHHHEKTNKPTSKHVRINADSAANKSYLTPTDSQIDNSVYSKKDKGSSNTNKNNEKNNVLNSSVTPGKSSDAHKTNMASATTNVNTADVKPDSSNTYISNTKSLGISNIVTGGSNTHRNRAVDHLAAGGNNSALTTSRSGSYASASHLHSKTVKKNNATSKNDQHLLADQNSSTTNNLSSSNTGNVIIGDTTKDVIQKTGAANLSVKTDSSTATKNAAAKQVADAKAKNQPDKSSPESKTSVAKKPADPRFGFDIKLGANTNNGLNLHPFLAVIGNYFFHNKWGLSIGANLLPTRIISGSYSKSNLNYVTLGDTGKIITHNSGKLTINSTRKIYYIDIPILATYKLTDKFTITAGPVISIPIKAEVNKNTLGPLSSSADTTTLPTVTPYVNRTIINSKVNFSLSAGARYSVKRFYFDAAYLQGISPYTISSNLGLGKIYYHTVQIGIGYHLFISKSK